MTTSFSVPRDTIITTALRKLQVVELGTTPDSTTIANAAQSLNIMIKAWQSQGIKLWTVQEYPIPLVAGQNAYTIGNSTTPTTNALVGPTPQPVGGVSAVTMSNNGTSGVSSVNSTFGTLPATNTNWSVCWNGSIFCAVSSGGNTAVSSDGITWTAGATLTNLLGLTSIAWNGNVFCVVCTNNVATTTWTSSNGTTWNTHSSVLPTFSCSNILYANGLFNVICNNSGTNTTYYIMSSPDGIAWTQRFIASYTNTTSTSVRSCTLAASPTGLVMAAISSASGVTTILTSSDSINWTAKTNLAYSSPIALTYGNGIFVALSGNTTNYSTSPDGTTWTAYTNLPITLSTNNNFATYDAGQGLFCVVTQLNTALISSNGTTWTLFSITGTSYSWLGVAGNGKAFSILPASNSNESVLTGYSYPSAGTYSLTFNGGTGTGAAGTYTISPTTGQITSTAITNAGTGYYGTAPTVSFLYGGITGAAGTVTVSATNTSSSITAYNYTADKPLKVIQAWARNISVTPNIDIPLEKLARQEYNILGSKFSTGMVNSIWYDPNTTYGTAHIYLTPDTATATNYILYLVGQRPLGDVNLSTDIPDFPNEWMQALIWGLADELAIEYGLPINHRQEIALKAEKYRKEMEDWDVEEASTKFTPDMRSRGPRI